MSLEKEKIWKCIFNTNRKVSQNHIEKQIMPSKTIVNWLFNDIWCYLFIACFDWKIGVFQQKVLRVYDILNPNLIKHFLDAINFFDVIMKMSMQQIIYKNLPANAIVRLPYPQSRGPGPGKVLALSADNQTRKYDTECWNHHSSQSTLRSKRLGRSKIIWWNKYANLWSHRKEVLLDENT